jgi:translation initiation factor IF-3
VLRNDKSEPPVCKIMLYKMELLKKLFKKLGKQQAEEKEQKSKTIHLSTNIAMNDLENKKRKAIEYLKQISNLKFYMKVNIYDEENVQKGRLMLMNIAEDLKEYAKIKVSPMQESKDEEAKIEKAASVSKKPQSLDDIKKQAEQSRKRKGEIYTTDDTPLDEDGESLDSLANYVFMEL